MAFFYGLLEVANFIIKSAKNKKIQTPGTKIRADHQLDFSYTRLPLSFFTIDLYRNISDIAKLLYSILLCVHEEGSIEDTNVTFTDFNGFVFVLIEHKELAHLLNVSHSTVQRALNMLEEAKLIERGEKIDKLRKIYLLHPEVTESTSMFYRENFVKNNVQKSETEQEDLVGNRIKKGVKLDFLFVKVPMFLFTNKTYQKLSAIAKLTLPIVINLHEYSKKSLESKKYTDKDGHIFVMFSQIQLANILNISRPSSKKAIDELKKAKLIQDGKKIQNVYSLYLLHAEKTEKDSIFNFLNLSIKPIRIVSVNKPKLKIIIQDQSNNLKSDSNKGTIHPKRKKNEKVVVKSSNSKWSRIKFSASKRESLMYTKIFISQSGLKIKVINWKKPQKSNLSFRYSNK